MTNKLKVKEKQFHRLGIRKTAEGNFEYINPEEKNKSKYSSIKKYERQ